MTEYEKPYSKLLSYYIYNREQIMRDKFIKAYQQLYIDMFIPKLTFEQFIDISSHDYKMIIGRRRKYDTLLRKDNEE